MVCVCVCVPVSLSWWGLEYTPTHGDSSHSEDLNLGQAYKSNRIKFFMQKCLLYSVSSRFKCRAIENTACTG